MKLFHPSAKNAPHRRQDPIATLALIIGLTALVTALVFMRHAYAQSPTTGAPAVQDSTFDLSVDPEVAAERLQRSLLIEAIGG